MTLPLAGNALAPDPHAPIHPPALNAPSHPSTTPLAHLTLLAPPCPPAQTDRFVDNEKTVRVNLPLLAMTLPPELRRMIEKSAATAAAGVLAGGTAPGASAASSPLPGPAATGEQLARKPSAEAADIMPSGTV